MKVKVIGVYSSERSLDNSDSISWSRDKSLALTRYDFIFLLDLYANNGIGVVLFLNLFKCGMKRQCFLIMWNALGTGVSSRKYNLIIMLFNFRS